jgi:hypothetical protein
MDLRKVKSTNLSAVGWQAGTLRILFQTGSAYDYFDVPAKLFNQLMAAESKGTFFQEFIKGQFTFRKVSLEKERTTMGMNKQQREAKKREAAAKAKDSTQPAAAEPPKAEPQPAAQPTPANKQTATFDKLKAAWEARGVDLSKMTATPDGKYLDVIVTEGWPLIMIGASGGIVLPEIRSYAKAFEAAVDGLALFQKQLARDKKKAAPAPAPNAAPAPAAPAPAKETVTQKKAKQGAAVEQQLQSASA